MSQPPERVSPIVPLLDGVGITPQGEPGLSSVSESDLPAAYQPKQPPPDPVLVERACEEFDRGRQELMLRVFGLMVGALLLTAAVA